MHARHFTLAYRGAVGISATIESGEFQNFYQITN
jgi:hypothetical protein